MTRPPQLKEAEAVASINHTTIHRGHRPPAGENSPKAPLRPPAAPKNALHSGAHLRRPPQKSDRRRECRDPSLPADWGCPPRRPFGGAGGSGEAGPFMWVNSGKGPQWRDQAHSPGEWRLQSGIASSGALYPLWSRSPWWYPIFVTL